jgi:hypothetical protein
MFSAFGKLNEEIAELIIGSDRQRKTWQQTGRDRTREEAIEHTGIDAVRPFFDSKGIRIGDKTMQEVIVVIEMVLVMV